MLFCAGIVIVIHGLAFLLGGGGSGIRTSEKSYGIPCKISGGGGWVATQERRRRKPQTLLVSLSERFKTPIPIYRMKHLSLTALLKKTSCELPFAYKATHSFDFNARGIYDIPARTLLVVMLA